MAHHPFVICFVNLMLCVSVAVPSFGSESELVRRAIGPRERPMAAFSVEGSTGFASVPLQALPGDQGRSLTVGSGCTYATVGDAIAAASPGDELLLEGGVTFVENLHITMDLVIRGGYGGCASVSTDETTLDGDTSGTVVHINEGLDVALHDLDITNGQTSTEGGGILFAEGTLGGALYLENVRVFLNQARWGGGIWAGRGAIITGVDVALEGNTASEVGGGLRLFGADASFAGSFDLYSNAAPVGAGVATAPAGAFEPTLTLVDASITYNKALTGDGYGGGIYLDHSHLILNPSVASGNLTFIFFRDNEALSGAAIYAVDSIVDASSTQTDISENEAEDDGGGIYAINSSLNFDNGVLVYDNTAGADIVSGDGGGLFLDNSDLFSSWALFFSNWAKDSGGGIFATNGSTIEMEQAYFGSEDQWSAEIVANQAVSGLGGGLALFDSTARLNGIPVHGNHGRIGGAIYAYGSSVVAASCTFVGNNAIDDVGDGIRLIDMTSLVGRGLTIADNDSEAGTGISVLTSSLDLGCSIVYDHATSIDNAGQTVAFCDIEGGYAGATNINVDPAFVNPHSDVHLQASSTLIDRCPAIATVVTDIDGEIRPWVVSNATLPFDMGADEVGAPRLALFLDDFESGDTSEWSLQVPE